MGHTVEFVVHHGYALLFWWLLAEQGALPLPSVPLLLACGALARSGQLNPALVVLSGLAACLIADNIWFQVGRRRGGRILHFLCRVALEPDSCVRRTENAFERYGVRSLLVAKFIPGLNAVAAPMAGSAGTRLGRFLWFDTLGVLIWLLTYCGVGYAFSDQIETVALYAMQMGRWAIVLMVALLAAWILWKFIQRQRFLRKLAVARITVEDLRDKLDSGEQLLIIDLRSARQAELFSIPGSVRISAEELAERHADIPRDRDVILFCS